ncbi:MAG: hypothetical protein Q8J99_03725 [Sulfuritalea sp.]|nr:hypothetical protein [Sulfuritalea sp.]
MADTVDYPESGATWTWMAKIAADPREDTDALAIFAPALSRCNRLAQVRNDPTNRLQGDRRQREDQQDAGPLVPVAGPPVEDAIQQVMHQKA